MIQLVQQFTEKAKYTVRDKRHSLRLRCKSCNYKVKIGGIKSIRQINTIFNDIQDEHKCEDANWIIERDFHAAEIPHTYVEQTTEQTHTGDTNWTDISGASISSASFVTGRKYLLIFHGDVEGNSNTNQFGVRSLHGSTVFTGSDNNIESSTGSSHYTYNWFTVWTAIASEGVKMQDFVSDSSNTVSAGQLSITAIEISEDLTEGTDWYFTERTTQDTFVNADWTTTNPEITFTPNGTDDWLIFANSQIDPNSAANNFQSRLNVSGGASSLTPLHSIEGEDSTNDIQNHFLMRVYTPTNTSTTFTTQSRSDGSGGATRDFAHIFALNLNKFDVHSDSYTLAGSAIALTPFDTEIGTTTIVPSASTDVFIMAFAIFDPGAFDHEKYRIQIVNVDQPPNQTSDTFNHNRSWDATDQKFGNVITVETLSSSSKIDFDASGTQAANIPRDVQIVAFTMELAGGGATTECKTYTIDSVFKALGVAKTYTIDALFKVFKNTKTYTIDSVYKAFSVAKTYTIDSIFKALGVTKTYTIDTAFRVLKNTKTYTMDSRFISAITNAKTYTIDAVFKVLKNTKTYTIDTVFQILNSKTYTIDSIFQILKSKTYTIDTVFQILKSKTYTIDTIFKAFKQTKTYTMDSRFLGPALPPKHGPEGATVYHKRRVKGITAVNTVNVYIHNRVSGVKFFVSNLIGRVDATTSPSIYVLGEVYRETTNKSFIRNLIGELVSSPIKTITFPKADNYSKITISKIRKTSNIQKTKIINKTDKYIQKSIDIITVESIIDLLDDY